MIQFYCSIMVHQTIPGAVAAHSIYKEALMSVSCKQIDASETFRAITIFCSGGKPVPASSSLISELFSCCLFIIHSCSISNEVIAAAYRAGQKAQVKNFKFDEVVTARSDYAMFITIPKRAVYKIFLR